MVGEETTISATKLPLQADEPCSINPQKLNMHWNFWRTLNGRTAEVLIRPKYAAKSVRQWVASCRVSAVNTSPCQLNLAS